MEEFVEYRRNLATQILAMHDHIDSSIFKQEFAALKTFG